MSTEAAAILDSSQTGTKAPDATATPAAGATANPNPSPKPDEKFSSKLDILARRERETLDRERAINAKEKSLETRLAEIEAKFAKVTEFETAKANPLKALELLGLNYDQITRAKLNDGEMPPDVLVKKIEDKFESKFEALTKQQEAEKQQREVELRTRAEAAEKKALEDFKSEIGQYLKDNPARYEFIAFEQADQLVLDVVDEHYTRTLDAEAKRLTEAGEDPSKAIGKVMTIAEASDKVELYLEQKYNKSRELKKVQAFWQPRPGAPKVAAKPDEQTSQKSKTLTNNMSATPTPRPHRPTTDEERIQRAIAYANGLRTRSA